MNKKAPIILVLLLLAAGSSLLVSCGVTESPPRYSVSGSYSWPYLTVVDGDIDWSTPTQLIISGSEVKTATVTFKNETTGVTTSSVYVDGSGGWPGFFFGGRLDHATGESVSFSTDLGVSGGPTVTPWAIHNITSPTNDATVTLPVTLTWTVSVGAYAPDLTWIRVIGYGGTGEVYQELLPLGTTSYTMTAAHVNAQEYVTVWVLGVNRMNLSGARDGSVVVVGCGILNGDNIDLYIQ